ncbi:hypothetical protein TSOC_003597 [Tetrabaena socialis]|uniref:Uncharacterized protein n=1 Tax=Tetrabaena socialis TaxID=47790 RepID=A0A2J8AB71_9CHLO|nr:hypothetical protein TSOC_003597 [Tetrabaena socialis]|eukprot:PNH09775.1 hypothetical protein TSOC_003597 [Tetrabaena socialis]
MSYPLGPPGYPVWDFGDTSLELSGMRPALGPPPSSPTCRFLLLITLPWRSLLPPFRPLSHTRPSSGLAHPRAHPAHPAHLSGHLGTWAPGHLGTWAPGHLGTWAPGHLGTWAPGHLGA